MQAMTKWDGHFTARDSVGMGEVVHIVTDGVNRHAKIIMEELLDNDLIEVYFKWED